MQVTRGLGFIGVLGATWLVSAGCSSDSTSNVPAEAGSGGGTASGGSTGAGGKSGSGGKASGGASSGGKSSSGGASSGGKSSSGGTSSGGASGSGGAVDSGPPEGGPEAGPPQSKSCAYHCNTDADCLTGPDAGADATYKCNATTKRCENPIEICNTNDDCLGLANIFWSPACTTDADCFPGDVCIDAGGSGLCATPLDPDAGGCSFPPDPITRPRFGDSGTVVVCGSAAGRCNAHHCSIGCSDDPASYCSAQIGLGLTCNATSGFCECATNGDCTAPGVSACNASTHHCECAKDADCAGVAGGNVCVDGTCGCSSASVCQAPFRKTTAACE